MMFLLKCGHDAMYLPGEIALNSMTTRPQDQSIENGHLRCNNADRIVRRSDDAECFGRGFRRRSVYWRCCVPSLSSIKGQFRQLKKIIIHFIHCHESKVYILQTAVQETMKTLMELLCEREKVGRGATIFNRQESKQACSCLLENITVKAVHEDLRIIQHFALKTFAVLNDWFRMVLISLVILWQLDGF
ncbi:hypothetical protein VTP01DRAFT_6624 [Rhizomucor pusillus]|uniref:uncharacterized protein n=1 Tax=Rhizomucor pusillus TaxID=4840 RepID=UPI0037431000